MDIKKSIHESFKLLLESKNYHSVFWSDGKKWYHHGDFDSHDDAREEMESMRNQGEKKVKKLVIPKDKAPKNWNDHDITYYVNSFQK